jgi:hypothetical protein
MWSIIILHPMIDCTHLTYQCHSGTLTLSQNDSILQICKHNQWKNVCSRDWGNLDAAVACRQLGYDGMLNNIIVSNGYNRCDNWCPQACDTVINTGGYTNSTRIYNHALTDAEVDSIVYDCIGQERHLQDCAHRDGSYCHIRDEVTLTCVNRSVSGIQSLHPNYYILSWKKSIM